MPHHRAVKLAFVQVPMIISTERDTDGRPKLAEGTQDMIAWFHVEHYEVIYLYTQPLYTQESVANWLDDRNLYYPSSGTIAHPPRLLFGKPKSFMAIENDQWKVGIIETLVAMRQADEIIIVDKDNTFLRDFQREHPNYHYFKEGDKRYPDYKVTVYENIADVPVVFPG